jgi:hypothetical protein
LGARSCISSAATRAMRSGTCACLEAARSSAPRGRKTQIPENIQRRKNRLSETIQHQPRTAWDMNQRIPKGRMAAPRRAPTTIPKRLDEGSDCKKPARSAVSERPPPVLCFLGGGSDSLAQGAAFSFHATHRSQKRVYCEQ